MIDKKSDSKQSTNPFPKMEEQVLDFWEKNKIFEKSVNNPPGEPRPNPLLRKERGSYQGGKKRDYVFYDGPPFITGLPHYATLLPSIAKDVVPRFWAMKGYRVERVWGWDCHGLPAENQVEKQLGLRNKKDIEKLGVDKFIDACRIYVDQGSEQWQWYINRIGRWVDMKHAYRTMDLNYMESVIWAFKELYHQGLIYEGYRSSLHCPRCATPLSKFEITMDAGSYRDVTDNTVVVKFKLKGKTPSTPLLKGGKNVYLLAWTTTPWTLPGNLALAVGEKIKYAEVESAGEYYIIAEEKVKDIFKDKKHEIIKKFAGKDLINLNYEPIFDLNNKQIAEDKNVFKIYGGEFVSTEEGTGVVHIAPNFGEDDFELGKKQSLPVVDLMDENGIYTKNAGAWFGHYFSKAGAKVLADLGDKLFSSFAYAHSYPFCYRCGTPLIYRAQKAWYLKISAIREKLLKNGEKVNWIPEHFKSGRFRYNLKSAPDWSLSRSRYWGSPIPVWKCSGLAEVKSQKSKVKSGYKNNQPCDNIKVVGSIKELEGLSGKKIIDLHKPAIDEVEFTCTQCGGTMKRVREVLDCWFESGAMPFAQFHYPFNRQDEWQRLFPADFIIEYTGQLRGWFYYLHVLANSLFNNVAFKNVIVTGVLAGTDGRKMSKSYGNYPDPKATLEKYTSDAIRMYFMSSPIMVGDDMSLSEIDIQNTLRKNIILLWNVFKFYELYAISPNPLLIKEGEVLTLTKREISARGGSASGGKEGVNILDQWILARLNQLIGEVTESMDKYDLPRAARPITDFINDISTWYLRRSRERYKSEDVADKNNALTVTKHVLIELAKIMAPFMPFMAETIWQKVTELDFKDKNRSVHLEAWPKTQITDKGGERVLTEMAKVRKVVELGLAKRDEAGIKVRQMLSELRIINYELGKDYEGLLKDELNVKKVTVKNGKGEIKAELDTTITEDLRLDGLKREIVRLVNNMRKNAGLTIKDKIILSWHSDSEMVKKVFKETAGELKKDTLSEKITENEAGGEAVKVNGEKVRLGIKI